MNGALDLAGLRRDGARRRDEALARSAHDERTAAILGIALGVAFTVCFVTGLLSHLIQHPPSWFEWSARPAGLYRITQGAHVATGTAAVPLLLAKLWSVWPRLFLALGRDPIELLHRATLVPLVGGALFMLFTGYLNIARWYPWAFFFPRAHYWVAWVTIGALIVHIAARAHIARRALTRAGETMPASDAMPASEVTPRVTRRGLLAWAFGTSAGLVLITAGQTVPLLRRTVLLAPRRPDIGIQDLPVNQTAADAGVVEAAQRRDWRLVVEVDGAERASLELAALRAMPQRTAELPIACVEGWSRSATWTGVSLRDVLALVGVDGDRPVEVRSLEHDGLYGRSTVEPRVWRDADTLLALQLNGEPLHLDHGYPLRLIAPNRPGVMQTKWLDRLVV
jgi:DMSO/TMAO reductase YedYZ molybdopterin-dependent catalytic subunit